MTPDKIMIGSGYRPWLRRWITLIFAGWVPPDVTVVTERPLSKSAGHRPTAVPRKVNEGSPSVLPAPGLDHDLGWAGSGQGTAGMRPPGGFTDDGPDEAHELPGHGCGDLALRLAHSAEMAVTAAESLLGLPGDGLYPVRSPGGLRLQVPRLAGRETVVPRRFHQDPPDMAVAGLGDPAGAPPPGLHVA